MNFVRTIFALAGICAALPLRAGEPVGCQGRIAPESRILKLAAPADAGTPIIQTLPVNEGDSVKAGQTVAVLLAQKPSALMREQAVSRREAARIEIKGIENAAEQARAENELKALDAADQLAAAEASLAALTVHSARKRLDNNGLDELKTRLKTRTDALEKLRADREAQIAKYDAGVKIAEARLGDALPGEVDAAKAVLEDAKASRDVGIREYDSRIADCAGEIKILKTQLTQGETLNKETEREPGEKTAAAKQVQIAKERLDALKKLAWKTENKFRTDSAAASARLAEAEAGVKIADARLAMTNIVSPINGTVLRINARPGEAVGPGGVAEVADLSKMTIEAEVNVADISRVKLGAAATIRVPGLEKTFSGKVTRIGLRAAAGALVDENPAAFKDLRIIPVTIALDDNGALADRTSAQVFVRIAND